MKVFHLLALAVTSSIFLNSCTKLEIEEPIPNVEFITPDSMETGLDRINIVASSDSLNTILSSPALKLLIPAQIQYFNYSGELLSNTSAQVEIKGTGSANSVMKPLGIHFKDPLNNSNQDYLPTNTLGEGDHLSQLQSIRLRNSGQDFGLTMVKDLAYSLFIIRSGMDLEIKYGKPVHVFLNNSYYGLFNLRSENSQLALSDLLQVPTESISIAKMDPSNGNLEFREGRVDRVEALLNAIENEDSDALRQFLDLENFIDYIVVEDYFGNIDWPHNNVVVYSVDNEPFRFFFFDADLAAYRPKNPKLPEMEFQEDDLSKMLQILIEDESFEKLLEERQEYWYDRFSPESFNAIVDELTQEIENDIPYLISKWHVPKSTLQWQLNIAELKRDFERTDHFNRLKYGY